MYAKLTPPFRLRPVASPRLASQVAGTGWLRVTEKAAPRTEGRLSQAIRAGRGHRTDRSAVRPMYLVQNTYLGGIAPAALRPRIGAV
jgi:hypothetical protein